MLRVEMKLSNGEVVTLDDKDFTLVKDYKWYKSANGYAVSRFRVKGTGKHAIVRMHRLIANTPNHMLTDHINGDKLDNRRENLRWCTPAQNMYNRKVNKNNPLMIKGVHKAGTGYRVRIQKDRFKFDYGTYKSLDEARLVADKAYKQLFKEFAKC